MRILESDLHLAMKDAVVNHLACGEHCWMECRVWYCGLRVDVSYYRNRRCFLVECETKSRVKRLLEKGRRRNKVPYRNVYMLVVSVEGFRRLEWRRLKGYFDLVLVYDAEGDRFTNVRDLRCLGWLKDAALDALVPLYYGDEFQCVLRLIHRTRVRFGIWLRDSLECPLCRLGVPTSGWDYCYRDECLGYKTLGEYVESAIDMVVRRFQIRDAF